LGIGFAIARFAALHNFNYGDVSPACQGAGRKITHAYNQSVIQEPAPSAVRDCQDVDSQPLVRAKVAAKRAVRCHILINNGL